MKLHALDWLADQERLALLDATITTDRVFDVSASASGFVVVERLLEQPLTISHTVSWEELQFADFTVVAEEGESLIGCAAASYEAWNRRVVVTHLYVDRASRRRGTGSRLLDEIRRYARRIGARCLWIETQNVNTPAIRFYQEYGCTLSGLDISHYDPQEVRDHIALFYTLQLNHTQEP